MKNAKIAQWVSGQNGTLELVGHPFGRVAAITPQLGGTVELVVSAPNGGREVFREGYDDADEARSAFARMFL